MGATRETAVMLVVFTAGLLASTDAGAAPRRVVVVNAAADQEAGFAAAGQVRAALEGLEEVVPLAPGELQRALEEPLPALSAAEEAAGKAGALLDEAASLAFFEPARARGILGRAESILLGAPPRAGTIELLARLNLLFGLVHIEEENRGLALTAFEMVRRLKPDHPELDPGRYKPEAVRAFAAAKERAAAPPAARARVSATFDDVTIYINGAAVGAPPLEVELPPGAHYVTAHSPDYAPSGRRIELAVGDSAAENLPLSRLTAEERALGLRRTVLGGEGSDLRESARAAAVLAGVDAAVILTQQEDRIVAAVYDARRHRLSYQRAADDQVGKLLGLLAPAPRPELPPDFFPRPLPPGRSWYETPAGIAGITGGVSVVVVAGVLGVLSALQDRTPLNRTLPNLDIQSGSFSP